MIADYLMTATLNRTSETKTANKKQNSIHKTVVANSPTAL